MWVYGLRGLGFRVHGFTSGLASFQDNGGSCVWFVSLGSRVSGEGGGCSFCAGQGPKAEAPGPPAKA